MQRESTYTGTTLGGRYVLGELLGTGGFGSVYKAVQADLGRTVAVKILHADAVLAGDGLARFAREARAAAALGHPNIAQVSDFQIRAGEPPFIVLEYLEGQTLGTLLRGQPRLDASRVCAIAHQVLSALHVAHGANIVHRDVKPDNVFLVALSGLDDFVKLLDFGIAKLAASATTAPLTELGTMLGTPAFMAPEQIANIVVDHRADLYAVGATMYRALAGKNVFDAENVSALLYAIVNQPVPTLSSIDPRIDPRLSAIVARALHKDPAGRFASAEEMRAALEPWTLSAPRVGIMPIATAPQSQRTERSPNHTTAGAPTYPVDHPPSFAPPPPPSFAPPHTASFVPPASASDPRAIAPTMDASWRGPSAPPPMPMSQQAQHAPSRGSSGVIVLVGGALALLAVLFAGGIVLYVLRGHSDADAAVRSWPWSSDGTDASTAVPASATGAASGQPLAAPGAVPGAPPKGGVPPKATPTTPGAPGAATAPATPAAPGVADAGTAPTAAPPSGGQRMAARSATLSLGDCTFDLAECQSAIGKVMPSVQACFAATEFDAPNHEVADYSITLDKTGAVTDVRRHKTGGNVVHPKLDGCVGSAIRRAKYPTSPSNTRVEVLFRARL
ncbi:MAG: serine/threonine protein kinase [Myxococcaceae bacterium]|nr:serine/threonine protein kinase [Myxococcaceae bacterium]